MSLQRFSILVIIIRLMFLQTGNIYASTTDDQLVYVVCEQTISGGVRNVVEKISWYKDLTLGEAVGAAHHDSASVAVLISRDSATIYKGRALANELTRNDPVLPYDVIVIGPVDVERAEALDLIPEVKERLGTKWSQYKHWTHRKITVPTASPSAR